MKRFIHAIIIILTGALLCTLVLAVDFYKRECKSLTHEYQAAKARIMSLSVINEELEDKLKEKSDRLTYLEQQYEPFIKILK